MSKQACTSAIWAALLMVVAAGCTGDDDASDRDDAGADEDGGLVLDAGPGSDAGDPADGAIEDGGSDAGETRDGATEDGGSDAGACDDACEEGETRCGDDGVERCEPDADGCLGWQLETECGDDQHCDDGGSTAVCVDGCEDDADCDGVATDADCDDEDAALGAMADDADCDGVLTADDCDDADDGLGAIAGDADCDGALTADDCDDGDPTRGTVGSDQDCDDVATAADCDDEDAALGAIADDADCDGVLTADDCDDGDPTLGATAQDADCDGATTDVDCDDGDPAVGASAEDQDCDGTPFWVDCDDQNDETAADPLDADCDGSPDVIVFEKEDFADPSLPENQDCITESVCITRGDEEGLYNAATEDSYDGDSPEGVEFAVGHVGQDLEYEAWADAIINGTWWPMQPMAMRIPADDLAFNVIAFRWTMVANGGGFGLARAPAVYFEKQNGADPTLSENQDCLAPGVCLTRGSTQSLYNAAFESGFQGPASSPAGTEWAPMATADASPGDYTSFTAATGNSPGSMVGRVMSLHVLGSPVYFDVVLTSWSGGNSGGGFAYYRSRAIRVGCTDPAEPNYDPRATVDDGFCGDWVRIDVPSNPDPQNPAHRDCVTPNVCITRGAIEGWFNAVSEPAFDAEDGTSPAGTLWAPSATADADPADYGLWVDAVDGCPPCAANDTLSLWIPSERRAFDVVVVRWPGNDSGGGFSYWRREVELADSCGNGTVEVGEQCDDQNDDETDGCLSNCLLPGCGNGVVEEGEQCDDGAGNSDLSDTSCRTICREPGCGDGLLDPEEVCDDGNDADGDGCDADCTPSCGGHTGAVLGAVRARDGMCVLAFDEPTSNLRARARCAALGGTLVTVADAAENAVIDRFSELLDLRLWLGLNDELVEDEFVWVSGDPSGYRAWADGEPNGETEENCAELIGEGGVWNDAPCRDPRAYVCETLCGNGTIDAGEQCDDGPDNGNAPASSCRSNCMATAACGDGILDPGEDCDDGNQLDGDGCAADCTLACGAESGALAAVPSPTDGACFVLFDDVLAYADAQNACTALGGALATIADADENQALTDLGAAAGVPQPWIGLNDIASEDDFVWASGDEVTYTNWGDGEPNNNNNEDCTMLRRNGKWNDASCESVTAYACELP